MSVQNLAQNLTIQPYAPQTLTVTPPDPVSGGAFEGGPYGLDEENTMTTFVATVIALCDSVTGLVNQNNEIIAVLRLRGLIT